MQQSCLHVFVCLHVFLCLFLCYGIQSQHCVHASTKGSSVAPRNHCKGKGNVHVLQDSQAVITCDGGAVSSVLFWHVTDPFRMLSEIPEGKTTAYFSASWRQGRSIFSETLLLREFGTSAEAVLGPFPLSFNRWEYLSWWSVISSAGSAQRSSWGQLKW